MPFRNSRAYFAPAFGRKQPRELSRHYLQGLLVQSGERRNAGNLAEAVPASPRALQRFLTESPWDDDRVIGRLQEYLGPRLEHPEAVWVLDGSDFPKQGGKSAGVARQCCGSLGKIANCQAGVFLAHVGPKGRVLVDKRLYLPEEWTGDVERCVAAGVPEARREYRGKTDLALEMLEQAQARGHLEAQWVAGDSAFGMSPTLREDLTALGMWYVLDVRPDMTVWAAGTHMEQTGLSGVRASPQTEIAEGGASHRRRAQPGATGGSLAGDNGGPRNPLGPEPAGSVPSGCG